MKKAQIRNLVTALLLAAAPAVSAHQLIPGDGVSGLRAIVNLPTRLGTPLKLASPAFGPGAEMPLDTTQYGANTFPGLSWSGAPAGVRAYVLIMQDTNVLEAGSPLLHCMVINIAGAVTSLPAAMTAPPPPARYGVNFTQDAPPYAGPKPPPGFPHHYDFQLFALDAPVQNSVAGDYRSVLAAMRGHVLASGEVVGISSAPQ